MMVFAKETDKSSLHSFRKCKTSMAAASGLGLLLLLLTNMKLQSCSQPLQALTTPELEKGSPAPHIGLVDGQVSNTAFVHCSISRTCSAD
jgi:hypothetical protein